MTRPPQVSFEFFPPKSDEAEQKLWLTIERLAPLRPRFVSVTYGAGGSTRERTHATLKRLRDETRLEPAAHLTCVGAAREEIDAIIRDYWASGIRHIVALRGDPPGAMGGAYAPFPGGYDYALDLVQGIRRLHPFEISVAAYPEMHQHAASPEADLDNLKRKIDAGADRAITQFIFDPAIVLRFLERARRAGITVPIVPGIMPVTNFAGVQKVAASCGATIPRAMAETFAGLDDDAETRRMVAASVAVELCRALQAEGIDEFHFYTLNRAELTLGICHMLGVRLPQPVTA